MALIGLMDVAYSYKWTTLKHGRLSLGASPKITEMNKIKIKKNKIKLDRRMFTIESRVLSIMSQFPCLPFLTMPNGKPALFKCHPL